MDFNTLDIIKKDELLIFNPYNNNNKEVTLADIQNILISYNVPNTHVFNMELYKRAFVHRSYVKRPQIENSQNNIIISERPKDCLELGTKSNERLEFLGDGVLECITKYYLYKRFPKENEGFMTEKKIALVKNEHIGKLAYEMGLHKYLIISKHAEDKNIRTNFKKLGCLFESFLGALFLDFNKMSIHDEHHWFSGKFFSTGPGFQMAQIFVENIFEQHVNWTNLIMEDDNYKNILQVRIQKEYKVTPTYLIIEENEDGFHMGVYLIINMPMDNIDTNDALPIETIKTIKLEDGVYDDSISCFIFLADGNHKIKKKAEQIACEKAIKSLEKIKSRN